MPIDYLLYIEVLAPIHGGVMARGIPAFIADIVGRSPPELLRPISLWGKDEQSFQEDYLQELLDNSPQLLPVRDFYPMVTSLCSLGREIPVDLGNKQGFIDNLFVTNDAHLVLVETKLHRNPEGIREVVAQTFQYGEAINAMSLMQLEGCIRKGLKQGNALRPEQTILARVQELAASGEVSELIEDFEDRLETHTRTGEILYLIVADGIRASVERMTHWLNEIGGSAPHKFGLIELRFYKSSDGRSVVIPRTLLRTKEISRHVVVVNIQGAGATVSAVVNEMAKTESGGTSITPRPVKAAGPPMTKDRLLAEAKAKSDTAHEVLRELILGLESLGLDSKATPETFQYGLKQGDDDFYSLLTLQLPSMYSNLPTKLIATIGDTAFVEHKRAMNAVAPFYRPEEVDDPSKKVNGLAPPYECLAGKVSDFVAVIGATRDKVVAALSPQ